MILSLALAAAAELSAPSPTTAFQTNDYPSWALQKEESAGSILQLDVDPSGKVTRCVNVKTVGSEKLAKEMCSILRRRRLAPARLQNGQKVHAFLQQYVSMFLPDTESGRMVMSQQAAPDAELAVNKISGSESEASLAIILAYDEAGAVTDCGPAMPKQDAALTKVACSQRALFDPAVRKDVAGQPVPYVTRKKILFRAGAVSQ